MEVPRKQPVSTSLQSPVSRGVDTALNMPAAEASASGGNGVRVEDPGSVVKRLQRSERREVQKGA